MYSNQGTLLISAATCLLTATVCPAADALPAFPGAEGFGSTTPGGRGGQVLLVTNLKDYVPEKERPIAGSLRAAIATKGPRIVVFRVAGTIALKAPILISEPFLTLAGQSAPGDGVCLKNYSLLIGTHDVVVRYLRVRPGDELGPVYKARGESFEPDGIAVTRPGRNVVIDHCSVSWAIDECLSVSGADITDVTIQWCMISESLHDSFHKKGRHGCGSLFRCNGNLSVHHNLYAHHATRCPRPGTYGKGSILLDFRNNVIHDSYGYSGGDPVRMNYVGNYLKRSGGFRVGGKTTRIFVADNYKVGSGEKSDPWDLITKETAQNRMGKTFTVAPVGTDTAQQTYTAIAKSVGASLPRRDAVDERVIRQLKAGKGNRINSQSEVGGYPELRAAKVPEDADSDGMPDKWEKMHNLDPTSAKDAAGDLDKDGYTNIEEFLNATDPARPNIAQKTTK